MAVAGARGTAGAQTSLKSPKPEARPVRKQAWSPKSPRHSRRASKLEFPKTRGTTSAQVRASPWPVRGCTSSLGSAAALRFFAWKCSCVAVSLQEVQLRCTFSLGSAAALHFFAWKCSCVARAAAPGFSYRKYGCLGSRSCTSETISRSDAKHGLKLCQGKPVVDSRIDLIEAGNFVCRKSPSFGV